MKFDHFLTDPFAPHPVVNSRNICFGGGGGESTPFHVGDPPAVPDYTKYIADMTGAGHKLQGWGDDLYKWAQDQGIKVSGIADQVSGRAGAMADQSGQNYTDMMADWKNTYDPLYKAQAADAQRMMGDLPNTQEQYAGKYGADVAQAFDASKGAHDRELRSYGLKAPGSGASALDGMVSNQRGLAQTAAMEQGRNAARNEAWTRVGQAQQAGAIMPDIANKSAATSLAAGNQQIGAPESAISTTVGAYQPGLSSYQAAYPYMKQWGDTMATEYNQRLAGYSAQTNAALKAQQMSQDQAANSGSGVGGMLGGLAGTVAGSFLGPMGSMAGKAAGTALGSMISAEGGYIDPARHYAEGGDVQPEDGDQVVTPDMSASQGAITDDVPARLNVGEFVIPKDVVEWRGESFYQKDIMKARKERESQTEAEPDMGPPMSAIDMKAPQFQSGGPPQ